VRRGDEGEEEGGVARRRGRGKADKEAMVVKSVDVVSSAASNSAIKAPSLSLSLSLSLRSWAGHLAWAPPGGPGPQQ
jgi:hypothetical protein